MELRSLRPIVDFYLEPSTWAEAQRLTDKNSPEYAYSRCCVTVRQTFLSRPISPLLVTFDDINRNSHLGFLSFFFFFFFLSLSLTKRRSRMKFRRKKLSEKPWTSKIWPNLRDSLKNRYLARYTL